MKKLKSLTVFIGEQALRMNNTTMKGEMMTPTPIHFDEENRTVTQYKSATERTFIDLSKVLMYTYEEEAQVAQ